MMIGSYAKTLPSAIIKMLVECLVFSRYTYALPVWGPVIHKDSLYRLTRLHNRSVWLTYGLHKYDHVSQHRTRLRWLPVESSIIHFLHCSMIIILGKVLFLLLPSSLVAIISMRPDILLIM